MEKIEKSQKVTKLLLEFLVPTLIVFLAFILSNQQNNYAADDSDSANISVDLPAKHLNPSDLPLFFYDTAIDRNSPIFIEIGETPVFANSTKLKNKLCEVKNLSPPLDIAV